MAHDWTGLKGVVVTEETADSTKAVWSINTHDACLCKNGNAMLTLGKAINVSMEDTMALLRRIVSALNQGEL